VLAQTYGLESVKWSVIPLILHPDFRDKIGFMADIKDEIGNISELVKRGKRGRPMRLVIFIDDLDRCHPTKAVEVLKAIMLLLADLSYDIQSINCSSGMRTKWRWLCVTSGNP
jgi:hypothetical protein